MNKILYNIKIVKKHTSKNNKYMKAPISGKAEQYSWLAFFIPFPKHHPNLQHGSMRIFHTFPTTLLIEKLFKILGKFSQPCLGTLVTPIMYKKYTIRLED